MSKVIRINEFAVEVADDIAASLVRKGLLYECGGSHGSDFHLMPDGPKDAGWMLENVEQLILSLIGVKIA